VRTGKQGRRESVRMSSRGCIGEMRTRVQMIASAICPSWSNLQCPNAVLPGNTPKRLKHANGLAKSSWRRC
jgi:hypothetical protein